MEFVLRTFLKAHAAILPLAITAHVLKLTDAGRRSDKSSEAKTRLWRVEDAPWRAARRSESPWRPACRLLLRPIALFDKLAAAA